MISTTRKCGILDAGADIKVYHIMLSNFFNRKCSRDEGTGEETLASPSNFQFLLDSLESWLASF